MLGLLTSLATARVKLTDVKVGEVTVCDSIDECKNLRNKHNLAFHMSR